MSVLITGGTGSFGKHLARAFLDMPEQIEVSRFGTHEREFLPGLKGTAFERIAVFSRDELKQHEMRTSGFDDDRLRYFIGDVRDQDRLRRAFYGVDTVIHAAAMKQVDTCEYNPLEAKKTNVDGTENVISAALDAGVRRVLMVGTDKAVDPVNLYGATKLVAEKLMVDANAYSGTDGTRFACTRYGNVISSRGSVLPLFQAQHAAGETLTVTDPGMTRFVLTLDQAVGFVLDCLGRMRGGEVFVPKLPAATVETIARAVAYPVEPRMRIMGPRPGEKRHELLVSENEAHRVRDGGDHFEITAGTAAARVLAGAYSSSDVERLDVAGFRALAGLGAMLGAAAA